VLNENSALTINRKPDQPRSAEEGWETCKALVLVVDDDPTSRRLMEISAEHLDITVDCVSSCAEALSALEMFSFDLILMDIRMPQVDGLMCTRKIRESAHQNAKQIPIIAITANAMAGDADDCLSAGMHDHLSKPFTLEQMHEKLCYWLKEENRIEISAVQCV
jgi:CheY-like chemotaxis protein